MRYTVFLKYYTNNKNEISIEDIKEYIVVFSRVISNNSEAVLEFLEDGFGKAILDIGYIKLIMIQNKNIIVLNINIGNQFLKNKEEVYILNTYFNLNQI